MERKYKGDPSIFCNTCAAERRICAGCGSWPLLEGWLADDEYFCEPCGDKVDDCVATDSEGVERTGLTLPQCYEVLGGDEGSDDVYYTEWLLQIHTDTSVIKWEAGEDSCACQGREYVIEVDVIVTRTYVVEANNPEEALARYQAGDLEAWGVLGIHKQNQEKAAVQQEGYLRPAAEFLLTDYDTWVSNPFWDGKQKMDFTEEWEE